MRNTLPILALLTSAALSGCGRGSSWVAVSGNVTYDGQPLPEGQVVFEPTDTMAGQRRDAKIQNGTFTLPPSQGLPAGTEFIVRIKGFKRTGRKYPSRDPALARDEVVQYLPARYNAASTLQVKISAKAAENQLDFALVSRAE